MTTTNTKIHALLQMALDCKTHHVHVSYAPHCNMISVDVYPADTDYDGHQTPDYRAYTFIEGHLKNESKLDEMLAYVEGLG